MKKLIDGIVEFRKSLTEEGRELFAKLALGQKPDALFIACSDSRVVPNLFASTNPGDLFVLRNVGNLIPPAYPESGDVSSQATLEFAIFSLAITNIIICGHSECGAMQLLAEGKDCGCPHLASWLKYGEPSVKRAEESEEVNHSLARHNQISQANVLQQMEHMAGYEFVKERMEAGKLRIHGWWFDIAHADVYCYEPTLKSFVLIDEAESKLILKRLDA